MATQTDGGHRHKRSIVAVRMLTEHVRRTWDATDEQHRSVAINPKNGDVRVSTPQGLCHARADGQCDPPLPIKALNVSLSSVTGNVWVTTKEAVLQLDFQRQHDIRNAHAKLPLNKLGLKPFEESHATADFDSPLHLQIGRRKLTFAAEAIGTVRRQLLVVHGS